MPDNGVSKDAAITSPTTPPIAIVGVSCLFPKAQSLGEYWANIKNRVDAITDVPETHWRPEDYFDENPKKPDHSYCRRGGFLSPVFFGMVQPQRSHGKTYFA